MTQEERNAVRWKAINADFDWSNDEWAKEWLPWVRLAVACLHQDDVELTQGAGPLIKDGLMSDLLDGLTKTKRHLDGLTETVSAALHRMFLAVERHGYGPDNPPPDTPISVQ
jgi:hypothetical protein